MIFLIPYHAAQAFNTWGELNYICLTPNKVISSFIVFFSSFFMPLLFLLAGMSSRYALKRRTYGQYIVERIKRLIVPFVFGTLVFCPILAYIGDKTNCGYEGGLFDHYKIFFTKWTDLAGFDGGFNVGQFWFLYFLFIISLVSLGLIALTNKLAKNLNSMEKTPFPVICLMVIPLPFLYDLLAVGGKSIFHFIYIFLIGYYVLSFDKVIEKAEKYRYVSLMIGLVASITNVYMFIWSGTDFGLLNTVVKAFSEWFMILALIGIGKRRIDFKNNVTDYMSERSFPLFSIHFLWIVFFQYWFSDLFANNIVLLFIVPIACAYVATLICAEICIRIPVLCFLIGTKKRYVRVKK